MGAYCVGVNAPRTVARLMDSHESVLKQLFRSVLTLDLTRGQPCIYAETKDAVQFFLCFYVYRSGAMLMSRLAKQSSKFYFFITGYNLNNANNRTPKRSIFLEQSTKQNANTVLVSKSRYEILFVCIVCLCYWFQWLVGYNLSQFVSMLVQLISLIASARLLSEDLISKANSRVNKNDQYLDGEYFFVTESYYFHVGSGFSLRYLSSFGY